jgi:hypothetical protein
MEVDSGESIVKKPRARSLKMGLANDSHFLRMAGIDDIMQAVKSGTLARAHQGARFRTQTHRRIERN